MVRAKLRRRLRRHGPPWHGGLGLHRQDAIAIEARRDAVQIVERPQEERGAAEQDDRQGDLHDHQGATQTIVRARPAALARLGGVVARRAQGRCEAEEQRRRDGHARGKAEDAHVEMRLQHHAFTRPGEKRNQERRAPPREQQSGPGSERHQDDAFGQQLAHHPGATRANREPHRHLVLPRGGAGEQQVGHIGAADEEHDADDRHDNHQRLAIGGPKVVGATGCRDQRDAAEVPALRPARHPDVGHVAVPQRFEIRARLFGRRTGRKAPDHAQPPALPRLQTVFGEHHGKRHVDRRPDLKTEEPGRRDPDDRHRLRADLDALAENGRIPSEAACPVTVADDGHRAVPAANPRLGIVGGRQQSSVGCANSEQVEVGAGRVLPAHPLRYAIDRHLERPWSERRDPREEPVVIAEQFEAGIGRAAAAAGLPAGVVDEEQSLRVVDRQRLDQHGVDQAEDGRVGADAEPDRHQGHERERRRPSQKTERVADVAAQFIDESQADGVAAFLLETGNAAELDERTPASLLFRHPCRRRSA